MQYVPKEGDRVVHITHGVGIVGDCSDRDYCYLTIEETQEVFFVFKQNISLYLG